MVPDRRLKLEVRQAREPEGGVDIHGLEEVGPITGGMEQVRKRPVSAASR